MERKTSSPQHSTVVFGGDNADVYRHPAYGQISVSRASTGGEGMPLYGSALRHSEVVILRIYESEVQRSLHREWHHAGRQHIEVVMSEAQWATFVSSFNMGDGVPCTIEFADGKPVDKMPWGGVAGRESYVEEFSETVGRATDRLAKLKASLAKARAAGKVGKRELEALEHELMLAVQDLQANLPYVQKSFEEAVENTVEQGRAEIHAAQLNAINRTGLLALAASMTDEEKARVLAAGNQKRVTKEE